MSLCLGHGIREQATTRPEKKTTAEKTNERKLDGGKKKEQDGREMLFFLPFLPWFVDTSVNSVGNWQPCVHLTTFRYYGPTCRYAYESSFCMVKERATFSAASTHVTSPVLRALR